MKIKLTKKDIIEALGFKSLNPFYNNDSLYECLYCSIVAHNDTIEQLKKDIKAWKEETPRGDYYTAEKIAEEIADLKNQVKEARKKRNELQKASLLLVGDDFSEYNE